MATPDDHLPAATHDARLLAHHAITALYETPRTPTTVDRAIGKLTQALSLVISIRHALWPIDDTPHAEGGDQPGNQGD